LPRKNEEADNKLIFPVFVMPSLKKHIFFPH